MAELGGKFSRALATPRAASFGVTAHGRRPWHDARAAARLRKLLVVGDAVAVALGVALPVLALADRRPDSWWYLVLAGAVITVLGLWAMRFQGLWQERVAAVRSVEASRIARALVMVGVVVLVLDRKAAVELRGYGVAIALVLGWLVIGTWRSVHRAYINAERKHGRLLRRVVLIGAGPRAAELHRLLGVHEELGMYVIAVVGPHERATGAGIGHLWKGGYGDARRIVREFDAEVIIFCAPAIDAALEARLTHDAHAYGRTVYVDPGVSSFDVRRFQRTHLAHQPLLEVEEPAMAILGKALKRLFDIAVATVITIVTAPLLVAIALSIRLADGGPALFRQKRVGQHGAEFEILKFRTMVVDAEAKLAELSDTNERTGPLFKLTRDPRVTRVGRLLRATSLDELPQLFNVLNGTMSLVGPRPALPDEVADFPEELKARHTVRPGITGLWQVEARDNPSFEAYRRLDLFYIENWSLALDMVILLSTLDHVAIRPIFKWRYRRRDDQGVSIADRPAA